MPGLMPLSSNKAGTYLLHVRVSLLNIIICRTQLYKRTLVIEIQEHDNVLQSADCSVFSLRFVQTQFFNQLYLDHEGKSIYYLDHDY